MDISIHAPAKGATSAAFLRCHGKTISIHAPAKGATEFGRVRDNTLAFQSTLPRRERRVEPRRFSATDFISIHAPAKGATRTQLSYPSGHEKHFNPRSREGSDGLLLHSARTEQDFNPRSREGSDRLLGRGLRCGLSFQSTLPRRERQYNRIEAVTGFPFQSTLPRRERPCAATVPTSTPFNFNPRSREGSDTGRRRDRLRRGYFNPRSREGSDPPAAPQALQVRISIHAPAKGATSLGVYLSHGEIFQSTLPRRERPILPTQSASPLLFQSTLPRRERRQ